jgi:hypothetical protein
VVQPLPFRPSASNVIENSGGDVDGYINQYLQANAAGLNMETEIEKTLKKKHQKVRGLTIALAEMHKKDPNNLCI